MDGIELQACSHAWFTVFQDSIEMDFSSTYGNRTSPELLRRKGCHRMPAAVQSEFFASLVDGILTDPWNADSDQLDAACVYALAPAGKLFRPVLMLHAASAVGADPRTVLPAAVALEHVHAASLVHDDIIDGDTVRRGRASVVAKYGLAKAVVVGDALFFELFAALGECRKSGVPDARVLDAVRVFARAGVELCRGQVQEDEMTCELTCGTERYLEMAALKTGSLCATACEVGALLGEAPPEWVAALGEYGRCLGVAFQIRDDLLPYADDYSRVGKDRNSDVRNGRMTFPVLLAYALGTPADRAQLAGLYGGDRSDPAAHTQVATVVERTGALAAAVTAADQWVARACDQLSVLPDPGGRHALAAIARSATDRRS